MPKHYVSRLDMRSHVCRTLFSYFQRPPAPSPTPTHPSPVFVVLHLVFRLSSHFLLTQSRVMWPVIIIIVLTKTNEAFIHLLSNHLDSLTFSSQRWWWWPWDKMVRTWNIKFSLLGELTQTKNNVTDLKEYPLLNWSIIFRAMNIILTCCTQLLDREVLARLLARLGNKEVLNLFLWPQPYIYCHVTLIPVVMDVRLWVYHWVTGKLN